MAQNQFLRPAGPSCASSSGPQVFFEIITFRGRYWANDTVPVDQFYLKLNKISMQQNLVGEHRGLAHHRLGQIALKHLAGILRWDTVPQCTLRQCTLHTVAHFMPAYTMHLRKPPANVHRSPTHIALTAHTVPLQCAPAHKERRHFLRRIRLLALHDWCLLHQGFLSASSRTTAHKTSQRVKLTACVGAYAGANCAAANLPPWWILQAGAYCDGFHFPGLTLTLTMHQWTL